jgi:hypothetical protein
MAFFCFEKRLNKPKIRRIPKGSFLTKTDLTRETTSILFSMEFILSISFISSTAHFKISTAPVVFLNFYFLLLL